MKIQRRYSSEYLGEEERQLERDEEEMTADLVRQQTFGGVYGGKQPYSDTRKPSDSKSGKWKGKG